MATSKELAIFQHAYIPKPVTLPLSEEELEELHHGLGTAYPRGRAEYAIQKAKADRQLAIDRPRLVLNDCREDDEPQDVSAVTPDQWDQLASFIATLALSQQNRETWLGEIKQGSRDAIAGIELLKSEWVEDLHFMENQGLPNDYTPRSWIMEALGVAARSQDPAMQDRPGSSSDEDITTNPDGSSTIANREIQAEQTQSLVVFLPNLKSIKTDWCDTENGLSFSDILPFAAIKSVEELEVFALSDEDESEERKSPDLQFSLRRLIFPYSAVTGKALGDFVSHCPRLEVLEYTTGGSCVGFAALVPKELTPGLQSCKTTLQKLKMVDIEGWETDWCQGPDELEDFVRPICSFGDFECLRELDVMASMLVGKHIPGNEEMQFDGSELLVESLPKSLHYLRLHLCSSTIVEQLKTLETAFEDVVPELKRLDINFEKADGVDTELWNSVVTRFEARGVAVDHTFGGARKSVTHSVVTNDGVTRNITAFG